MLAIFFLLSLYVRKRMKPENLFNSLRFNMTRIKKLFPIMETG